MIWPQEKQKWPWVECFLSLCRNKDWTWYIMCFLWWNNWIKSEQRWFKGTAFTVVLSLVATFVDTRVQSSLWHKSQQERKAILPKKTLANNMHPHPLREFILIQLSGGWYFYCKPAAGFWSLNSRKSIFFLYDT